MAPVTYTGNYQLLIDADEYHSIRRNLEDVLDAVVTGTPQRNFCEPENILVNQYLDIHGHAPIAEEVYLLTVQVSTASTSNDLSNELADSITSCFGDHLWYGTVTLGR